jgi:hypothetical protein
MNARQVTHLRLKARFSVFTVAPDETYLLSPVKAAAWSTLPESARSSSRLFQLLMLIVVPPSPRPGAHLCQASDTTVQAAIFKELRKTTWCPRAVRQARWSDPREAASPLPAGAAAQEVE